MSTHIKALTAEQTSVIKWNADYLTPILETQLHITLNRFIRIVYSIKYRTFSQYRSRNVFWWYSLEIFQLMSGTLVTLFCTVDWQYFRLDETRWLKKAIGIRSKGVEWTSWIRTTRRDGAYKLNNIYNTRIPKRQPSDDVTSSSNRKYCQFTVQNRVTKVPDHPDRNWNISSEYHQINFWICTEKLREASRSLPRSSK